MYFKYLCDALLDKNIADFTSAFESVNRKFQNTIDEDYADEEEYYRETPIYFSTLRKSIPIVRHF